jgi:predicted transcriptional regulator
MLTKTQVAKQLEKLPDEFTLDDLVEQLILIQKIEKGLKDSEEGKVISEEELDNEIEKWFK